MRAKALRNLIDLALVRFGMVVEVGFGTHPFRSHSSAVQGPPHQLNHFPVPDQMKMMRFQFVHAGLNWHPFGNAASGTAPVLRWIRDAILPSEIWIATGKALEFRARLPIDMEEALAQLRASVRKRGGSAGDGVLK